MFRASSLLVCCLALACAAGVKAEDDFKLEDGFTSLFNGKDLSGWEYKGSKENLDGKTATADERVKVIDGVIVMMEKDKNGKGGIKDLYTAKKFPKNFHFKTEFRAALKADSGVYVRGPQMQLRDFVRRNEHKHLTKFKNDDWNTLEIVVKNDVLISTVNNKALTDKDDFSMTFKDGKASAMLNGKAIDAKNVQIRYANVATCSINGQPLEVMPNVPGNGGIGLQAESGKFEFRRVRLKELP